MRRSEGLPDLTPDVDVHPGSDICQSRGVFNAIITYVNKEGRYEQ